MRGRVARQLPSERPLSPEEELQDRGIGPLSALFLFPVLGIILTFGRTLPHALAEAWLLQSSIMPRGQALQSHHRCC